MTIAVVDVGGTHVKVWLEEDTEPRRLDSGPGLTPQRLVDRLRPLLEESGTEAVSLGLPGPVRGGRLVGPPPNLGGSTADASDWMGFDFAGALGLPVRLENDAALAALGAWRGERLLFLGLGTGMGCALVEEGRALALEVAHLPFPGLGEANDGTFEDAVGQLGLDRLGVEVWRRTVAEVLRRLAAATVAADVVVGGGNARLLSELPQGVRRGAPDLARRGGLALWRPTDLTDPRDPVAPRVAGSPAWQRLIAHRRQMDRFHLRQVLDRDPDRFRRFSHRLDDLLVDFSKHRITEETLVLLADLACRAGVEILRDRMFAGEPVNLTEERAVLHVALRNRSPRPYRVDGVDVMPAVRRELKRMASLVGRLREGTWKGWNGRRVTDFVHLGIGGSDLGPRTVTEALTPFHDGPRVHFVSNVDPADLAATLERVEADRTVFCVASKSFTTQETLTNAHAARRWFLDATGAGDAAVARHFVALSTNARGVAEFGIAEDHRLEFWDWVGGRYSLWSVIGMPIAVAVGCERFEELLAGAHAVDEHFRTASIEDNLPVLMGLLGLWYHAFWGAETHAVLPYDHHLALLPAHLQQVDMESNGKGVTRDGRTVSVATGPVVWGEPGTNGQHAFFQLLHQGTRLVPCDFLVAARAADPALQEQHRVLVSHALAQTQALAVGRSRAEALDEMARRGVDRATRERLAPHRTFPGNRPSTTLLYPRLDPRTLGMILALYEHKVFVQGAVWNVNSFDQWGVELGKELAGSLLGRLESAQKPGGDLDPSTAGLLESYREMESAVSRRPPPTEPESG